MRRIISMVLLIAIIFVSVLTSCSDTDNPQTQTTTELMTDITEPDNEYGYIEPGLSSKDYGGRSFRILYPEWSLYNNYYFADEYSGEVVNDAIYERARRVEEMFNIKFEYVTQGYIETIYPELKKVVTAGDPVYDLALTHCVTSLTGIITDSLIVNWNDIPGLDLSQPYWNQSVCENFEYNGMLPFMSSDYILPDVNSIFFNKDLIVNLGLDNPYELVTSGKWTLTAFAEMAKDASQDINGNGIMDDNDQYGFVGELGWQFASFLTASDQGFFGKDEDGIPTLVANNEKTQDVLEKICAIIHKDNISYTWAYAAKYNPTEGGIPPVDFGNNKSLFYLTPLSLATTFRDVKVDYGIIPLPKYDESQENYITLNWAGFMCVPASSSDLELIGVVTEMLAAESCRTVIPAFFDVLLDEKVARDDEAKEMLEIIFGNNIYDLGLNLGRYTIFSKQVASAEPNNTSYLAANIASIEKAIADYIKGCEGYEN